MDFPANFFLIELLDVLLKCKRVLNIHAEVDHLF